MKRNDSRLSATDNRGIQWATTGFSLTWLLAANLAGLLLAAMLIWPKLNAALSPWTYGRWMPLHTDWHLYGWCSLPLLGLICWHFFSRESRSTRKTVACLSLWSAGLLLAAMGWLAGHLTGKPFLNWKGISGLVFTTGQLVIWGILLSSWFRSIKNRNQSGESRASLAAKALLLLALLPVPFILLHTSDTSVYPPVNPNSGGATGHSLLLSTLSLVFLMGLLPRFMLGLNPLDKAKSYRTQGIFWLGFLLTLGVYGWMEHGDASNHRFDQIVGLGTLLIWPFLVYLHWQSYNWQVESRHWRFAFFFWWMLLAIDGWMLFLPGILETMKFTNALVAHSHLAMGGMVSALNVVILTNMGPSRRLANLLNQRSGFYLWNGGCLLYVLTMTVQGWREGNDPGVLFGPNVLTSLTYWLRLGAGVLMLVANSQWLLGTIRNVSPHWIGQGLRFNDNLLGQPVSHHEGA